MPLVHSFVYFARVGVCPSSLPLGVGDWLRLVIVAFPGPFLLTFVRFDDLRKLLVLIISDQRDKY